jgi:hypothetical protein
MPNKPAQKERKADKDTLPDVTRWAALVTREVTARKDEFAAAAPSWPLTLIVACILAIIRQESGGNPEIANKDTGSGGLTQLHPKWYDAALLFDPVANVQTCVGVLLGFLQKNGGKLPEAIFSRGWGDGNFKLWLQDQGDDEHAAYVHHLFTHTLPLYGRWLTGWIEAGKPVLSGSVASKGKRYDLALAVHKHGKRGADLASPYEGTFTAHGTSRTYKATTALAGVMPDLGALSEPVQRAGFGLGALLLASLALLGIKRATDQNNLSRLIKTRRK